MGWRSRARKLIRTGRRVRDRVRSLRDDGRLVVGAKIGYSRIGPVIRLAMGVGTPELEEGAEATPADVTTVALVLPIPRELHDSLQDALPEEGLQLTRPLVRKT